MGHHSEKNSLAPNQNPKVTALNLDEYDIVTDLADEKDSSDKNTN